MTTFYTVVSWLLILGYWLIIAGVTLRILMKRRAVPSAMAWLLIIFILPLVGIIAYLSFGELHLGKRRAERARAMWPSTAKWRRRRLPVSALRAPPGHCRGQGQSAAADDHLR